MRHPAIAGLVLAASLTGAPTGAVASSLTATYAIIYNGLVGGEIGQATLRLTGSPGAYAIDLIFQPRGMAKTFGVGTALAQARGVLAGGRFSATSASLAYSVSAVSETRRTAFANGALAEVSVSKDKKGGLTSRRRAYTYDPRALPAFVPVPAAEQKGVLDPLSAAFLPVAAEGAGASANCQRRLRIYDGQRRFDLTLAPADHETGAAAPALVCRASYRPIGGHSRDDDEFTRTLSRARITVALTPSPDGTLLLPSRISFADETGRPVGEARLTGLQP